MESLLLGLHPNPAYVGQLITVMWARVGAKRRWLVSYITDVAHLSQEMGN